MSGVVSKAPESKALAIVGAGNMGNAIARLFYSSGWSVVLIDPSDAALATSKERLQDLTLPPANAEQAPATGGPEPSTASLDRPAIQWHTNLSAAHDATLIIEAAPESLELKQGLFRQLEACCAPDALIATNTSGISINQLARPLQHPERFIGTHFFTPADIIPLVEVIAGDRSSASTVDTIMEILRAVGKRPVLVRKDIPGFIANRLQHALAREAMSLLEKGIASAEDIDTVAKWSLGVRLALTGPLEQRDINGLDVHHAIAGYLYPDLENRAAPLDVLSDKVKQGHLGVKRGQGFYDWTTSERREALRGKENALRALVQHLETYPREDD